ncbi:MAG TPA: ABC transporter permease, partial [Bryobacteraceae bacterium]|nr:ABC transporter permease [Bryobacteraceae bacterium]
MYRHLETLAQDVRYGLRTLRRTPSFTLVAVLTLALGIGAATMVFTVTDALLLHVFPYRNAGRLTLFYIHELRQGGYNGQMSPSVPQFLHIRQGLHTFEELAGFWNRNLLYDNGQGTQEVPAASVTTNTFRFLGVDPLLGRTIVPDDERPGAPPVCVIGYRFWQEQLHGDPNALGAALNFDGQPRTLIGIMPPRFQFRDVPVWVPYILTPATGRSYVEMVGRLRPGVGVQAASTDLEAAVQRVVQAYPADFPDKRFTVSVRTLTDATIGDFRRVLYTLAAAAAILLLIACSNVANLLLVRATRREREIAIRAAVGASRLRLVRQLLVESCILAAAGAAAGCMLTDYGVSAFAVLAPQGVIPGEAVIGLNQTALWFAVGVTIATTLLCGLAPAILAVRGQSIRPVAQAATGGTMRGLLVVAEVALSIVLLVGAGLMTRTLYALTHVSLGFSPENLLLAQLDVPRGSYQTADQQRLLVRQVVDRVTHTPGVRSAAFALGTPPGSARSPMLDLDVPGKTHQGRWTAAIAVSSEGYLQMLGRPLVRGRDFSEADVESARHLVVVNETFAHSFFGTGDPIGQRVTFRFDRWRNAPPDPNFEVIGVVVDAKNRGLREPIVPEAVFVYSALPGQGLGILVKTEGPPLSMVESLRRQVWAVDSTVVLSHITPVEQDIRDKSAEPRFGLVSIGGFAAIGLVLAMVGVFSVMAYAVSVRRREIGIRMALGAQRGQILGMVLRKGLALVAAGIVIGLAASLGLTRLLASQLWGVAANDPWTLAGVTAVLASTTLAACWLPARRAA